LGCRDLGSALRPASTRRWRYDLRQTDAEGELGSPRLRRRVARDTGRGRCRCAHGVDPDRLADVLERLLAEILSGDIDLAPDLAISVLGDADRAWIGQMSRAAPR